MKSSRLARLARKVFHRNHAEESRKPEPEPRLKAESDERRARPRRLQADVPLDLISNAYTPNQTSLKGPFRASGIEFQRDQDDVSVERWHAEDRFTNKSGDPRIGTHGRSYEPGESRTGKNR
ncbi:MAG TPA: hypothetical protein VG323_13605 [Thermoanaerobaculia bacterium]|nr:hypothetical protein [Thermoanaerobaculia bacterium]